MWPIQTFFQCREWYCAAGGVVFASASHIALFDDEHFKQEFSTFGGPIIQRKTLSSWFSVIVTSSDHPKTIKIETSQ